MVKGQFHQSFSAQSAKTDSTFSLSNFSDQTPQKFQKLR
jgi:hypothetical protein